uniref:DDE Tnp4 domain-containing protein n=1 Tax=Graphocephala atropunctata TaxID=36148 RepID=A0A1B6M977_9HEMI
MDKQSYSRTLSYALCELTMPVKRHVYNYAVDNIGSFNHHLLTAAVKAVRQQKTSVSKSPKNRLKRLSDNGISSSKPIRAKGNFQKAGQITEDCAIPETACQDSVLLEESDASFEMDVQVVEGGEIICESDVHNTSSISSKCDETEEDSFVAELSGNRDWEVTQNDNSDSCDEITSFYSDPLLLCSDTDFQNTFRITRTTYRNLLELLSKEDMEPIENVPLYKKLLIVLWLMGNSGSYRDAAEMFNVTEEDAANCFFDVCATLYNKCDNVIRWPSIKESNGIASRIEDNYGFPEVVGVLGCTYFSISIPKESLSRREHFNAKTRTYCISLQIVCDDKLIIRDIFPGLPGSKPVAQVLRNSPLCERLTSKVEPRLVESHRHLLARKDYPQLTSMLTPYTSKGGVALTGEEEEFNALHEGVCVLVDRTFQMLRDRFLTLKLLDPEVATMVLVSACVLHNICIENSDMFLTDN